MKFLSILLAMAIITQNASAVHHKKNKIIRQKRTSTHPKKSHKHPSHHHKKAKQTNDQPQSISIIPLRSRVPKQIPISALTPQQMAGITAEKITTLSPDSLQLLQPSVFTTISPSILRALSVGQLSALSAAQLNNIKPSTFKAIPNFNAILHKLDKSHFQAIPTSAFKTFHNIQFSQAEYDAITSAQLAVALQSLTKQGDPFDPASFPLSKLNPQTVMKISNAQELNSIIPAEMKQMGQAEKLSGEQLVKYLQEMDSIISNAVHSIADTLTEQEILDSLLGQSSVKFTPQVMKLFPGGQAYVPPVESVNLDNWITPNRKQYKPVVKKIKARFAKADTSYGDSLRKKYGYNSLKYKGKSFGIEEFSVHQKKDKSLRKKGKETAFVSNFMLEEELFSLHGKKDKSLRKKGKESVPFASPVVEAELSSLHNKKDKSLRKKGKESVPVVSPVVAEKLPSLHDKKDKSLRKKGKESLPVVSPVVAEKLPSFHNKKDKSLRKKGKESVPAVSPVVAEKLPSLHRKKDKSLRKKGKESVPVANPVVAEKLPSLHRKKDKSLRKKGKESVPAVTPVVVEELPSLHQKKDKSLRKKIKVSVPVVKELLRLHQKKMKDSAVDQSGLGIPSQRITEPQVLTLSMKSYSIIPAKSSHKNDQVKRHNQDLDLQLQNRRQYLKYLRDKDSDPIQSEQHMDRILPDLKLNCDIAEDQFVPDPACS